MKRRQLVTIAELIRRQGRWLGGIPPYQTWRIKWAPGTRKLPYPPVSFLELANRVKLDPGLATMREILEKPNPLLKDARWEPARSALESDITVWDHLPNASAAGRPGSS